MSKQGRLKVEIKEIFGDATAENLPWIYPIGYNSGVKLFNVPDKDVEVGVIFIGDIYTGFYGIGHYPTTESKVFDFNDDGLAHSIVDIVPSDM